MGFSVSFYEFGYSKNIVNCSFLDSQSVAREFRLKRSIGKNDTYTELDRRISPLWKVMSDDKNKLILFKETVGNGRLKEAAVHTLFFIDKRSGDFRFRNYMNTEYINTIRGKCSF